MCQTHAGRLVVKVGSPVVAFGPRSEARSGGSSPCPSLLAQLSQAPTSGALDLFHCLWVGWGKCSSIHIVLAYWENNAETCLCILLPPSMGVGSSTQETGGWTPCYRCQPEKENRDDVKRMSNPLSGTCVQKKILCHSSPLDE